MSERKLLILDINGLLCRKINTKEQIEGEVIELPSYKVQLRPGCHEFLDFCYRHYDIAFFSSTLHVNADAILKALLNSKQHKITIFKWFRDRTRFDPDSKTDKYATVKVLKDIFDNPVVNRDRIYSEKNTLICDDSVTKIRLNDPKNTVIIPAFTGDLNDTTLYEIINTIEERFTKLD